MVVSTLTHDSFDYRSSFDQKRLVVRLATMGVTVLMANLIVRIERHRRERAVVAEAERGQRVLELEREASEGRHRLAQEIHDGISQRVYMLTLGLETVKVLASRETDSPTLTERLDALVHLSKQTLLDTRHLLVDVSGVMGGDADLVSLVRKLADEFASVTAIRADVRTEGRPRAFAPESTAQLYRVTQEALANVYRHSGASRCGLSVEYRPDNLILAIEDNGHGFDEATAQAGHGIGNMRERAARLGGTLSISRLHDGGTNLVVTIPYPVPGAPAGQ